MNTVVNNCFHDVHFYVALDDSRVQPYCWWLQKRIPQELMGRVMSLLIFSSVGLTPVSNALAGAILQINLNVLFIDGGLLMAALSLLSIMLPAIRQIGSEPVVNQAT